jgi:hypothetical protein
MSKKAEFVQHLREKLSHNTQLVDQFARDLSEAKHPLERFEGSTIIEKAALVGVLRYVLAAEEKNSLREIYDFAVEEALRKARFPRESTSVLSNEAHRQEGSAWVFIAETARDFGALREGA